MCELVDRPDRRVVDLSPFGFPEIPVVGETYAPRTTHGSIFHRHAGCIEITLCVKGSAKFDCIDRVCSLLPGQVDAMEATVTAGNPDESFADLCAPGSHEVEVRWAQQVVDAEGNSKLVGYKAFMRANGKTIPGVSVEPGEAGENEVTLGVTRYRLVKDGAEVLLIDQLNGIFKFNGVDYSGGAEALL